jgi:hypothetical protein
MVRIFPYYDKRSIGRHAGAAYDCLLVNIRLFCGMASVVVSTNRRKTQAIRRVLKSEFGSLIIH